MYKFFRKNNKKLLAIFGVGLMIVFILPSTFKNSGYDSFPVGKLDGERVYTSQIRQTHQAWQIAAQELFLVRPSQSAPGDPEREQLVPLAAVLGQYGDLPDQIQKHNDMYFLLLAEAQKQGVTIGRDEFETLAREVRVRQQDPKTKKVSLVSLAQLTGRRADQLRLALRDLMLVNNTFARATSAIKISQPLRDHAMAEQGQEIKLNLVSFAAKDFASSLPAPTDEQLDAQFNAFKDRASDSFDAKTNPFGFGYRFPDRVKLQYIQIPAAEVRRKARETRSEYDWDVEARKYFLIHPEQFALTRPSTRAASAPAVRPFAEVRNSIIDEMIKPVAEQFASDIRRRIITTMANDYQQWLAVESATRPSTAPAASSPAGAYGSYEYLQNLARSIQDDFGVLPATTSLPDWLSRAEVNRLPALGELRVDGRRIGQYLTEKGKAFVPESKTAESSVLHVNQPSPPLTDELGNVFMVRLAAMEAAHAPEARRIVAGQVEADLRLAESYKLAEQAASALLGTAKNERLATAAELAKRPMITTGAVAMGPSDIPGYPLTGPARAAFIQQAFGLLTDAAVEKSDHPTKLIELPSASSVVVAELESVKARWPKEYLPLLSLQRATELEQDLQQLFAAQWFNYKSLTERVKYVPDRAEKDVESESAG